MLNDWTLTNLPPEGHADAGQFFFSLYEAALSEQFRLMVRDRALDNHALYRGEHDRRNLKRKKTFTPINLFFANVERTVSNITANNPTAEVVDLDGLKDGSEDTMTARLRAWWKETYQRKKHRLSARNMEIYGYTTEKPYWDLDIKRPDITVNDLFAVIPAPGIFQDWSLDAPYLCYLYVDYIDALEAKFGIQGIAADETFSIMGQEREEFTQRSMTSQGHHAGSRSAYGNYADTMQPITGQSVTSARQVDKGLVIEIWIRGASGTEKEETPVLDENGQMISDLNTGDILYEYYKYPKYPDSIRKITIAKADVLRAKGKDAKSGIIVLDDVANPNLNPRLPIELAKTTYPWGRFPIIKADSYRDASSSYGFSAAEQVGDLLLKVEEIFTRLFVYARSALSPALIVEKYCGISKEMIESQAGKSRLILMPTKPGADIRYLETPNLPATFFNVLDLMIGMFDRIYQIEDADRGQNPTGVIAASAIVALQERNAVLMQAKVDSSDNLVSERGMWAIGLWQNFGTKEEPLDVNGGQTIFRGVDYAGRRLNYAVEAGSTVPRTSIQTEEQVKWLAGMRLLDLRTILETINFPNWKAVVERNGENQLDMALNILVQAGMSQEEASGIKQFLINPQGGPGDTNGDQGSSRPGVPMAKQGQRPMA